MAGDKKGRASSWGALSLFLAGILALWGLAYGLEPVHFLEVQQPEGGCLYRRQVHPGEVFTYRYVHSVEQTVVCERYRIGEDYRILLTETEFSSFGAGLPYGAEGRFVTGNGTFILTDLERPVEVLRLKPTALSECALEFENHRLNLDRPELDGRLLEVRVVGINRFAFWRGINGGRPWSGELRQAPDQS
jgi:hypothetical protein